MAITWTINNQTGSYDPGAGAVEQGQWDLYYDKGARNDFNVTGATTVNVKTFQQDNYEVGDTYDYVVDSQFWGSEVYYWDDGVWTTYINAAGDLVDGHALTFKNVAWDNKAPVYLYIRKTPNGGTPEDAEYAAYQVFVDSLNPVFEDDEITINPELHRDDEHKVKEYWFNKADVVEAGGEGATGATLTITFDDTEDLKYLSSGIAYLQYSTGKDNDPEHPGTDIAWTPFDAEHVIAVDPENITYDEATGKWTLTAFLPDSVDKDGDNLADGNYYQFKLVDGVGNISDGEKIFRAPVDDTAAELDYQPTMIWQDATAPVVEDPALTAEHTGNNAAQPINGKGPEDLEFRVITDRNKPGTPYSFTVSGTAQTQAADKGTELSVVVTYTGVYQELILEDGNYILGEAVTFDGDVATDYDGSVAGWTSNAISLYPEHVGAQAIGYYDVVAKVVDAAGNETSYDHFYVYFDNTLPASPDVVLNDESAIYDEDAKSSYIKEFGAETTVTVTPGSYGTLAEGLHAIKLRTEDPLDPEAPIYYEFASAKGALDIPALVTARAHFDPANWGETAGEINLDNFENIWAASIEDGKVKEDAYSVIFFTQNAYEIESSTFVDQVSVVRFVVDNTKPVDLDFELSTPGTVVDDIIWYSDEGADVSLTFKAYDKWNGAKDADSVDHVSGVDVFSVNGKDYEAVLDDGNPADVFYTHTIDNIRTGTPGIVTYDFTATDGAGNVSDPYDPIKVGIDSAAPVINNVYVTWGDGEDQKRLIDAETKTVTFTAKDLADFAEQTITKFWLTIDVADVSGATSGDIHGVGLTDNDAKTYYQIDGGLATAFLEAGTKTALNDIVEDTTYVYGLKYTDLFDHVADLANYTVIFDGGADFTVAGTYIVNGEPAGLTPKGPQYVDEVVAAFDDLDEYAKEFDLAFTIDSDSGIQTWTMTKAGVEDPIFSYDAAKGAVPVAFALDSTDGEDVALWQLEEGLNKYTVTIQDKAGNDPVVQEFTLMYDSKVTGTLKVVDTNEKEVEKNADGKYYVTTNHYKLYYGVVDTEENPELSGADLVYFKESTEDDYDNHPLELNWYHGVFNKVDGTTTTHQAIVTDKAGNRDEVNAAAIVVVDQTDPTISVTADVDTTARKAVLDGTKNLTIANTTIADTITAGLIDGSLTVNWTTLIDGDLLQITVADTNLAKVFLGEVELDHAIIKLATEAYVGDSDATIVEGTNTWTITGIDKAGNETTATLTVKFDETDPEIVTVKLDGYDATAKGGDTRATALENKVFAADALNFALDMTATDNVSENVEVYYTFVSEDVAVDEATFDDAGNWSVWAKVDGNIESAKKGFYRFAAVDEAGNFAQTKYYYVDQAVLPTKPVISYIDEEGTPFTDVDDKPWFTKGIQVIADFQSGHGYDQWNFIAYKFDDDEYTKAYQAAVEAGDDKPGAAALLAAVHTTKEQMEAGEWNEDFVTHVEKTVSDAKWTWEGPEYEMLPTEYWMFSISESGDVTVGEYKYQFVKVDTTAPVIILDAGDYVEATWTNKDVTINMEVESAGTPVVSQTPLVLPVVVTEEGKSTSEFTATNEAGTTTKEYFEVWIDKTAPVTSVNLNGYEEGTWTKEDVEITASATDPLSGIAESTYVDQTITEEGETEVVMDATDVAGNATTDTVVVKIDKTAPVASVDLNGYEEGTWTKEDVQITASAEDALSGIATSTFVDQTITEEGKNTVAMEATDLAGNVKNDSVQVWIDKTAPVFQNVDTHGYEEGTWTSDPVTITATAFDALSGIAGQADFEATLTESGVIEWTAVDKAGNEQKFFFEVLIDNGSPVITLDAGGYEFGTWTNKDAILVDMNVTSASPIVEQTPAEEDLPVVVTEEGKTSLEFYAKNEVGNTATENVQVWIDRTAPVVTASYAPAEDLTPYVVVTADFQEDTLSGLKSKEYSFDGATWSDYSGNFKVYQNTAVYFRATDNAGNVGTANITISNVAIDYAEVEGDGSVKGKAFETEYGVSGKYVVNGDFGEITGKLTVKNGGKSVFTANIEYGVLTTKDGSKTFMLDNSKTTVIDLTVNEKKTAGSTEWDIQFVTDDDRFIEGDNGDDTVATAYDLGVLDYEGEVFENWVGFGDEIDYRVFTLESSAKLTFGFEAEDTAKMTVYQLNTKTGKLKSLGNVAISAKEVETTKYTKELLVEAGTYYIAVQSTNKKAASGTGAGEYEVSVAGEFYPAAADLNLNNQTWKTASIMDEDPSTRWVGFGDAADFYKFSVDENGKIAFDMDEDTYKAVLAKELKITCLTDTGKSVALEQLDKDTLVSKKEMAAGDYILGVTCANTKKFNTYYDITVAVL